MEVLFSGLFWGSVLLLLAGLLAYIAAGWITWTVAGTGLLTMFTLYADVAWWTKLITWTAYLVPLAALNIRAFRRPLLSDRVLRLFREAMPPISPTERQALEAGSVWWEGELFRGRPRWRTLLQTAAPTLLHAEREFLVGPVERYCEMVSDYALNVEHRELPPEAWELLKSERFLGLIIPERYGGLGFSALGHGAVIMKIASRSISAALTVMIPNSVGPAKLLLKYGTEAQKEHYLPRLARGEEIPCLALTGPEAGSDAAAVPDTGVVCRGEHLGQQDVLGIRLNFDKRYISLAPVATLLAVAFKLYDPDHLLGGSDKLGITLALLGADVPGVEAGRRHDTLHMGFHNGPLRGRDVFVPLDAVIGGTEGVGQGWRMLMESLGEGRAISLPALSTAAAKLAARVTGAYARIRYQFKTPIGSFEGVQEALAAIAGHTYVMDSARLVTLGAVAEGTAPAVASAIVKYNLTERCREVIRHAMDIHAGAGICLGPRNLIGEFSKFPSIGVAVEGANILTRSLITFGQGVVRCHPYLQGEIEAAQDEDSERGAKAFDRLLIRHAGYALSNALRTLLLALTGGRLVRTPPGLREQRYYVRQLSRMSAAFALVTDAVLLALRGEAKKRERLSGRLADIASQLYLGSATLKHYHDQGDEETDHALLLWVLDDCLFRIQQAFDGVLANFPVPPAAWLLRRLAFPIGGSYRPPRDELEATLAAILMVPSSVRDRLTSGMYLSNDRSEPLGRLEDALAKVTLAEPLERKLRDGERLELIERGPLDQRLDSAVEAKLLTPEEANMMRMAEAARLDALAVDDF